MDEFINMDALNNLQTIDTYELEMKSFEVQVEKFINRGN